MHNLWHDHKLLNTQFLTNYVNGTHNLTCILQDLNSKKLLCAMIVIQNVLKRHTMTNSNAKLPPRTVIEFPSFHPVFPLKFLHIDQTIFC